MRGPAAVARTRRLILFLRAPVLGRVKTRLAVVVGAEEALRLYQGLLADQLARLRPLRRQMLLYVDVPADRPGLTGTESWARGRVVRPQRGTDLGERMASAFSEVFAAGVAEALLAGSDIPGLDARLVQTYFRKLSDHPMVLGPAQDGGYYLIGFRREAFRPELFVNIPWSTAAVGRLTLEAARGQGLDCWCGPILSDVDTYEDLRVLEPRSDA